MFTTSESHGFICLHLVKYLNEWRIDKVCFVRLSANGPLTTAAGGWRQAVDMIFHTFCWNRAHV